MDILRELTDNSIILSALIAWAIAQILKVIIVKIKTKSWDLKRLIGAGGMPSSHTSFVVAMAVSVLKSCGYNSPEFAISLVLALIVMYDASGVRRAVGENAKVLNQIIDLLGEGESMAAQKKLKELLGHTPIEVLAGAVLGTAVGMLY